MIPPPVGRIITAAVMALIALVTHLTCDIWPEDDAYITYRYAANLVAGNGAVYNEGQAVFGVTTPLYLFWLAGLKSVFTSIEIPVLAIRFNLIWFLLAGLLTGAVAARVFNNRNVGWLISGVLLTQPDMLRISMGGMESFMFLSAVMGTILLALSQRVTWACACAGVATLIRPEGVLCLPLLAFFLNWKSFRSLVICGVAFSIPILIWAIPATLYYGSPVPHSIIAKKTPLYPLPAGHALAAMMGHFEHWITRGRPLLTQTAEGLNDLRISLSLLTVQIGLLAGVLGGYRLGWKRACPALMLVVYTGFYTVTNPLFFEWYFPPLYAFLLMTLVGGGFAAAEAARSVLEMKPEKYVRFLQSVQKAAVPVVLIWLFAMWSFSWLDRDARSNGMGRGLDEAIIRVEAYRQCSEWIMEDRKDENAVVLAPEIGAVGFYYDGPILDACGLVSPEAIKHLPVPDDQRGAPEIGAVPRGLVLEEQPEYMVTMHFFAYKSIIPDPWFQKNYELVKSVPLKMVRATSLWGVREIQIFRKRLEVVEGEGRDDIPVDEEEKAPHQS